MNLAVNARDAMPEGGQADDRDRATSTLDAAYARRTAGATPGRYVMLAVTDTGSAWTPRSQAAHLRAVLHDQGAGKGTGLGLATVYGIVQQSGGHIGVYSEPGTGTTLQGLPAARRRAVPRPAAGRRRERRSPRARETILLVEDEDAVRALTRRILARGRLHGPDGARRRRGAPRLGAVRRADPSAAHGRRDAGDERAEAGGDARRAPAELSVLFMSGYTDDAIIRHGVLRQGVAFLQKPFTPRRSLGACERRSTSARGGWRARSGWRASPPPPPPAPARRSPPRSPYPPAPPPLRSPSPPDVSSPSRSAAAAIVPSVARVTRWLGERGVLDARGRGLRVAAGGHQLLGDRRRGRRGPSGSRACPPPASPRRSGASPSVAAWCAVTTANDRASPRAVTGIPAAAGPRSRCVTPGTT